MVQAVRQVMGSDGERQMKLSSLTHHSPPAVWPSVLQDTDRARGLGTPDVEGTKRYFGTRQRSKRGFQSL